MGRKLIDHAGQVFGRLTVLSRAENDQYGQASWLCRCECGNEHIVLGGSLRTGGTKSCGCLHREGNNRRHGYAVPGHRLFPMYNAWSQMNYRCSSPQATRWSSYGGRGITVWGPWARSFERFLADMGDRPPGRSLDRIDNDGPYHPWNCRWATLSEQNRNQRPKRKRCTKSKSAA